MGYAWMLAAALAAVLGSCLFNALVRLLWRPCATAKRLRRQGVRGPEYKFFVGNLDNIKRLHAVGTNVVLDVASNDFLPIAQPQFRKWIPLYGRVFLYWFGSTPNICVAFSTLFNVQIPGFRHLPTKKNLKVWRLDKKVRSTLMQIIKNRLSAKDKTGYGNDLLGLMLEAYAPKHGSKNQLLSVDEIIDECKTFFFTGQETTSHLLSWTMFLLSTHPEWHEKLREEVLRECGKDQVPTHDMLNKLKLVNMFHLETLRLYSPVPLIRRRTRSAVKLGGIAVPEGAMLTIPITTIHRDKEVWGEDGNEFDPLRFHNGAGATKTSRHLNELLSFSMGPRACIGQNFAMIEVRAMVAMILQRFALSLSPKYVHALIDRRDHAAAQVWAPSSLGRTPPRPWFRCLLWMKLFIQKEGMERNR